MRLRLRPAPTPEEMSALYPAPHVHTRWHDHIVRVDVTTGMALEVCPEGAAVVDLSCGDAAIARRLQRTRGARLLLGDFAPGYDIVGPIEETMAQVPPGSADLWILSETLEHLDDPDAVLAGIRTRTKRLILSTPESETDASNPEHVWSWDKEEVERMLRAAGFEPIECRLLEFRPLSVYCFQIWICA